MRAHTFVARIYIGTYAPEPPAPFPKPGLPVVDVAKPAIPNVCAPAVGVNLSLPINGKYTLPVPEFSTADPIRPILALSCMRRAVICDDAGEGVFAKGAKNSKRYGTFSYVADVPVIIVVGVPSVVDAIATVPAVICA